MISAKVASWSPARSRAALADISFRFKTITPLRPLSMSARNLSTVSREFKATCTGVPGARPTRRSHL